MIALFDLDSLVYDALYRIVSISDMRKIILDMGKVRGRKDVIEIAYNRMEQMINQVLTEVESCTTTLDETLFYLTNTLTPQRNLVCPTYKRNRKKNKWANSLRNYIIQEPLFEVKYNFDWEADDLIFDKATQLRNKGIDFVVISKDKDLKQIEGLFFDYYKVDTGEIDQYFNKIKIYRGLSVISKEDADYLLAKQMLMGDSVDNIQGIPKIGQVKSTKILEGKQGYGLLKAVWNEYKNHYKNTLLAKIEFRKTYQLVKLGCK